MENETSQSVEPVLIQAEKPGPGFFRKNPVLFTALVGLLAVAIVYFWKDFQNKSKVAAIEKKATEQLMENSEEMLKIIAKPFVWSIRAELLRENMDQVNTYLKEMVREKNFQQIHLIYPEGKIVISTDKKLEGQSANTMFESSMLKTDSIMVIRKDVLLTIAAPVMGYDKKLGIVIMNYSPEKFNSDMVKKTDTTVVNK